MDPHLTSKEKGEGGVGHLQSSLGCFLLFSIKFIKCFCISSAALATDCSTQNRFQHEIIMEANFIRYPLKRLPVATSGNGTTTRRNNANDEVMFMEPRALNQLLFFHPFIFLPFLSHLSWLPTAHSNSFPLFCTRGFSFRLFSFLHPTPCSRHPIFS